MKSEPMIKSAKQITSRLDVILPLVKDKTVLDIGCVDHDVSQKTIEPNWLHQMICNEAQEVVGFDIEEASVKELQKQGYSVICGNIETTSLNRQFDVAVAGEIIEHIQNPGKALKNIRKHLKPEGILILTTPNPFYIGQFFRILKRNTIKVRPDHICWYDPQTLTSLLAESGFVIKNNYWISPKRPFQRLICSLRSHLSPTFLITAKINNLY